MTLDEFLRQYNLPPQQANIGNENFNVNAYTNPTLGGNVNAATETPAGLLSATIGKEVNKPSYRDYAITKDNLRGGLLNTEGNTSPYAEYITDDIKAQITGGKSPNVSGEYSTNFAGGRGTIGGQYDATGLAANAAYEKQLENNILLKLFGNINPYDKRFGFAIGQEFK
jgi:hypothetical protein